MWRFSRNSWRFEKSLKTSNFKYEIWMAFFFFLDEFVFDSEKNKKVVCDTFDTNYWILTHAKTLLPSPPFFLVISASARDAFLSFIWRKGKKIHLEWLKNWFNRRSNLSGLSPKELLTSESSTIGNEEPNDLSLPKWNRRSCTEPNSKLLILL